MGSGSGAVLLGGDDLVGGERCLLAVPGLRDDAPPVELLAGAAGRGGAAVAEVLGYRG